MGREEEGGVMASRGGVWLGQEDREEGLAGSGQQLWTVLGVSKDRCVRACVCVLGIAIKGQASLHQRCFFGSRIRHTSSFWHCTHQVSKSEGKGRESSSTVASLIAKEPFLGTARGSWQGSEGGPEERKAEGGTREQEPCEKSGEGKWG